MLISTVSRHLRAVAFSGRFGSLLSGDLGVSSSLGKLLPVLSVSGAQPRASVGTYMHDTSTQSEKLFPKPTRWPQYNDVIHAPEDGPVERYYCHFRENIKYSHKKMYYVAAFIRGMSIDEAIKQLHYTKMKGATIVKEILEEAREIAIAEHNFEYASKMWIAESFCAQGFVMRGFRKHARMRFGEVRYFHTHYLVKLVEGEPPANYLPAQGPHADLMSPEARLNQHIEKLRKRRIDFAL